MNDDMSKCNNEDCIKKLVCERYTYKSKYIGQSYNTYIPENNTEKDFFCESGILPCKHISKPGESCRLNNNCTYPKCHTK